MSATKKSTQQVTDPDQSGKQTPVNYQSLMWKDLRFWKSEKWKEIKVRLKSYHGERENLLLPRKQYIFRPLIQTKPQKVRVVMIGKEPDTFRKPYEVDGFAYSSGIWSPMFRDVCSAQQAALFDELELEYENEFQYPSGGSLLSWARQGVLLWNWRPTSHYGTPQAHSEWGWDKLSIEIMQMLYLMNPKTIFVPWGIPRGIDPLPAAALRINSMGPMQSYHNAGWFGSDSFSRINDMIKDHKLGRPIDWNTKL